MITLPKYTMGVGDRFAHQGCAQLQAMIDADAAGVSVSPVWNKSHREHTIIGTDPGDVRAAAAAAVKALGWTRPYFVDADHIGLSNVDLFLEASDFFTLDVADFTGEPASPADIDAFLARYARFIGTVAIPGIDQPFEITAEQARTTAERYLLAIQEAGKIYRHIEAAKGAGNFVTEVSMDETEAPQTPVEMLFILAAIADEGIPAQTIAPKFTGRFNKGVDYVGDVSAFAREFEEDVLVVRFAINEFGLPASLKLSVHSGSDKFSIYGPIHDIIKRHDAGLHLKTAGTTWLEEIAGLALAGDEGLVIAREVYAQAHAHAEALCAPYASVIDIDVSALPSPETVDTWTGEQLAAAVKHDPSCDAYNPNLRQLLHVGYKVAASMGERYLGALKRFEKDIGAHVTENIYDRHAKPIFIG